MQRRTGTLRPDGGSITPRRLRNMQTLDSKPIRGPARVEGRFKAAGHSPGMILR